MPTRRGVSLIELLTVIAIIALLASMVVVTMLNMTDQAREDATAATIVKINELLEERLQAFGRATKSTVLANAADELERRSKVVMIPDVYGGRPFAQVPVEPRLLRKRVAEILARKVLYRTNFPQRFAEMDDLVDFSSTTPGANNIPDLLEEKLRDEDGNLTFNLANHTQVTESSELLYFMLTEMAVFGVQPVGTDGFTAGEVQDTDGDGLPEFVDNWGNPLRFYRWPCRLIDVDYVVGQPDATRVIDDRERAFAGLLIRGLPGRNGLRDANGNEITRDPLLMDPNDTIGRVGFELMRLDGSNGPDLSLHYNQGTFHTPDVYHTPLVMSAGSDGVLGIAEPFFIDTASGVFGNLASPPDVTGDGAVTIADIDPATSGAVRAMIDSLTDNISNRNRRAGGSN